MFGRKARQIKDLQEQVEGLHKQIEDLLTENYNLKNPKKKVAKKK